jgi:pimeloyl-ACP methyl ester carboxylesterase
MIASRDHVVLPDGRRLAYDEAGDPAGRPVLFFHGLAASRRVRHPDDGIAAALGVRLLTIDRPGIGDSDPLPRRRLLDWPADVATFASELGLDRFAVAGWSAGGPHALACGALLGTRVTRVGLLSSAPPFHGPHSRTYLDPGWRRVRFLAGHAPRLLRRFFERQAQRVRSDPERVLEDSMRDMPAPDRALLEQPPVRAVVLQSTVEAFAQGGAGVASDAIAVARPWGFGLEEVETEVVLWHGEADATWPPAAGRHLASRLPRCEATFLPDQGHLAFVAVWDELLRRLSGDSGHA